MAARRAPADARTYAERMLARLWALDELLVRHGFPPMSPWWRATVERFYRSGKPQLIARVGRRGGKSSTLCRVGVVEALYGEHEVAPGDEGVFAIVSTKLGEAGKRLITIEKILSVLGVATTPLSEMRRGIRIVSKHGRPVAFELFAATVAGVSGFTGIGALCDEVAKWKDVDTGANPATEVLASLRPTMAGMPNARLFLVSSPFSTLDAHYEAMKEGETQRQCVAEAATWVARPSITEAETHMLEPDEATRLREYGAVPMSGGESYFFDHLTVDAALLRAFDPKGAKHTLGADPAMRSDSAGGCVGGRALPGSVRDGWAAYGVRALIELTPMPGRPLVPGNVVRAWVDLAKPYGVREIVTDYAYVESVREHASAAGMSIVVGTNDKIELYTGARVELASAAVSLGSHALSDKLARQIKETMQKPTANGLSIFSPRRAGSHGDLASAWVHYMWRLRAGHVPRTAESAQGLPCGHTRWDGVRAARGSGFGRRGGASDVAG